MNLLETKLYSVLFSIIPSVVMPNLNYLPFLLKENITTFSSHIRTLRKVISTLTDCVTFRWGAKRLGELTRVISSFAHELTAEWFKSGLKMTNIEKNTTFVKLREILP